MYGLTFKDTIAIDCKPNKNLNMSSPTLEHCSHEKQRHAERFRYTSKSPPQPYTNFKKLLLGSKPQASELIRLPFMSASESDGERSSKAFVTRNGDYVSGMTLVIDGLTGANLTPWSIIEELRVEINGTIFIKLDCIMLRVLLEIFQLKWSLIGNQMFIPIPFELCMGNNILVLEYLCFSDVRVYVRLQKDVGVESHHMMLEVQYGLMNGMFPKMTSGYTKSAALNVGPSVMVEQRMRTLLKIGTMGTCSELEDVTGEVSTVIRTNYPIRVQNATSAIFFYFTKYGKMVPVSGMFKNANICIEGHDMFESRSIESLTHHTSSLMSIPGVYCIFNTGAMHNGDGQDHAAMNLDLVRNIELRITPSETLMKQCENYELHIFSLNTLVCTYFEGWMTNRVAQ
jgi:hypothetical protein